MCLPFVICQLKGGGEGCMPDLQMGPDTPCKFKLIYCYLLDPPPPPLEKKQQQV